MSLLPDSIDDEIAQRVEQRGLFLLGEVMDARVRCGVRGRSGPEGDTK